MKRRSFLPLAVMVVYILVFGAQAVFASAGPDSRGVYRPTIYINGENQALTATKKVLTCTQYFHEGGTESQAKTFYSQMLPSDDFIG